MQLTQNSIRIETCFVLLLMLSHIVLINFAQNVSKLAFDLFFLSYTFHNIRDTMEGYINSLII